MGLDMYVWALDARPDADVDFVIDVITDAGYPDCFAPDPVYGQMFVCKPGAKALAAFRKHPDLHGAIQLAYEKKGGTNFHWDSFHGNVILDLTDIEELERLIEADELPTTTGFFFGESNESDKPRSQEFIRRAKAAIADGKTVVYESSW